MQRIDVAGAGKHGDAAVRRCPVARECGGCQRVSQPYADQLAEKQAFVAGLFAEAGLLSGPDAPCLLPIKGMVEPYFYRNKVTSPFVRGKRLPVQRNGRRFTLRRGGRVVECGGLENRLPLLGVRGFESLLLRHLTFSFD